MPDRPELFRPQLSVNLLHFASYRLQEFEPVLDERVIVNPYVTLNGEIVPAEYDFSDQYEVPSAASSTFDCDGRSYRYEPHSTRDQMSQQVYR